jgi:dTMP kinase
MFITFEGIEGCGKTTQIRRLARRLASLGIPVVLTYEPGGTRIGKQIRRVLLDSRNKDLAPLAEVMLYAAERAQHVKEVIRPALDQGKWVLCDRFMDATVVYQGMARGQDMKLIQLLNRKVTLSIRPNLTFLLDCPVEVGLERAILRNKAGKVKGQDRFEKETQAFHQKVRRGYLVQARKDPKRFIVVRADGRADEVEERIFRCIQPLVSRPRGAGRAGRGREKQSV